MNKVLHSGGTGVTQVLLGAVRAEFGNMMNMESSTPMGNTFDEVGERMLSSCGGAVSTYDAASPALRRVVGSALARRKMAPCPWSLNNLSTAWLSWPIGGISVDKCSALQRVAHGLRGGTLLDVRSCGSASQSTLGRERDSGISENACATSRGCGCQRANSWATLCCAGVSAEVWNGGSRG